MSAFFFVVGAYATALWSGWPVLALAALGVTELAERISGRRYLFSGGTKCVAAACLVAAGIVTTDIAPPLSVAELPSIDEVQANQLRQAAQRIKDEERERTFRDTLPSRVDHLRKELDRRNRDFERPTR